MRKFVTILCTMFTLALLTGCSSGINLGGILGGMTGTEQEEEFVDPNLLTEIVEVTGGQESYEQGTKYQFDWQVDMEDVHLKLSVSTTDNTCYLVETTHLGVGSTSGEYDKIKYYKGTYTKGEGNTIKCSFTDALEGVIPGKGYDTKVIGDAIDKMLKQGHYDQVRHDKEMAMYVEGKTLRTYAEGSVVGKLVATLDAQGKFTPNVLDLDAGLAKVYRMGFEADSYYIGAINGYGVLCRDNWYNYDNILIAMTEYAWTEGKNTNEIWFEDTYYLSGKLKTRQDYENNIPTRLTSYNEQDMVVSALYYDEAGNPSEIRYTDGDLSKRIDYKEVFADGMYVARWYNESEKIERVALYDGAGNVLVEYGIKAKGQYLEDIYCWDPEAEVKVGLSYISLYEVNNMVTEQVNYDNTYATSRYTFDAQGNIKSLILYDENGQDDRVIQASKEGNQFMQYYFDDNFMYIAESDRDGKNQGYTIYSPSGEVKATYFATNPDNSFQLMNNYNMTDGTFFITEYDSVGNEASKTFIDANGNPTKTMIPKEPGNTINTVVCQTNCLTYYREMTGDDTFVGYYFYDKNGKEVYSYYNSGMETYISHEESDAWLDIIRVSAGDRNNNAVQIFINSSKMYIWEFQNNGTDAKSVTLKDASGNIILTHQAYSSDRMVKYVGWSEILGCFIVYESPLGDRFGDTTGITLYRVDGSKVASMHTNTSGHNIRLIYTGDGEVYLSEEDANNQPVRKLQLN